MLCFFRISLNSSVHTLYVYFKCEQERRRKQRNSWRCASKLYRSTLYMTTARPCLYSNDSAPSSIPRKTMLASSSLRLRKIRSRRTSYRYVDTTFRLNKAIPSYIFCKKHVVKPRQQAFEKMILSSYLVFLAMFSILLMPSHVNMKLLTKGLS